MRDVTDENGVIRWIFKNKLPFLGVNPAHAIFVTAFQSHLITITCYFQWR